MASETVFQPMSAKVQLAVEKGDIMTFSFRCPLTNSYQALTEFVHSKLPNISSNFCIQYVDEESDIVTCCDDKDIEAAFEAAKLSHADVFALSLASILDKRKRSQKKL